MSNYPAGVTQYDISALSQDVEDNGSFDCCECAKTFYFADSSRYHYYNEWDETIRPFTINHEYCCEPCYIAYEERMQEEE